MISLSRELTFRSLFLMVVSSMVGVGIFTASGFVMQNVSHPVLMMAAWILAGIFSFCGALSYAELGGMFPKAGGDYIFLRESFGLFVAFLSGWVSLLVGFSAPIAAVAVAFGKYFFSGIAVKSSPAHVLFVALLIITSISAYHCLKIKVSIRIQNLMTVLKLSIIVTFIIAGLLRAPSSCDVFNKFGDVPWSRMFSNHFVNALIFVSFAYSGWNAPAYVGTEIKKPEKNLVWAIILGSAFVTVLYFLMNLAYIFAIPDWKLANFEGVAELAGQHLFGFRSNQILSLGIALSLVSTLSVMIMIGPRLYYAMALDGVFFKIFSQTSSQTKVPTIGVLFQMLIACGMVLTFSFEKLLYSIGFMLSFFSLLTVSGLIVLRYKNPEHVRPYKTWGYPWPPILFIFGNLWIVINAMLSNQATVLLAAVVIGSGSWMYGWFKKRNLKNAFSDEAK